MNQLDVTITEIIEKPKQIVTEDFCGWVVKVKTDCQGIKKERVFTATTKKEIEMYKIGYTWPEQKINFRKMNKTDEELKIIKEALNLSPIDILEMIRDLFEHDYKYKDEKELRYIPSGGYYICTNISNITIPTYSGYEEDVERNVWGRIRPDIYPISDIESLKALGRHTKRILRLNRPSEELFREIYEHPLYRKEAEILASWWEDTSAREEYYYSDNPWWKDTIQERIKYLNLLVEKLKTE